MPILLGHYNPTHPFLSSTLTRYLTFGRWFCAAPSFQRQITPTLETRFTGRTIFTMLRQDFFTAHPVPFHVSKLQTTLLVGI